MKKIIISIILISYFQFLYAQPLSPQMVLYPLCFQENKTCEMARVILTTSIYGNFRLTSSCRGKTEGEKEHQVCYNYNGVLGVEAFIDLPKIGDLQWRNQCYPNIHICQSASQIWRQLIHPLDKVNFDVQCAPFDRKFWSMDDKKMKENGLLICPASDPIELKVKAVRVK